MIKSSYEKLGKKYKLPLFDAVNSELEISEIESDEFLLRKIRKKISELVDSTAEHIGSLLQPSADSLADMHECRFFTDKDKKRMVELYKKLMTLSRVSLEAEISKDDKTDAALVKDFFRQWPELKKEALYFIKKMKSCWEKETEIEEKLEYFG